MTSKRLALLQELLPAARRVISFYSPNNVTGTKAVQVASDVARVLGLDFVTGACHSPEEVLARISALPSEQANASSSSPTRWSSRTINCFWTLQARSGCRS